MPAPDALHRIHEAFSPHRLGSLAGLLATRIEQHFQQVTTGEGPVLNWAGPEANVPAAKSWLNTSPSGELLPPTACEDRFRQLIDACLSHGNNLHHPRYIGHQVPASVPIAALFDFVGSVTNQVMAIYEMGPWATAVERAMIDRVGGVLGLDMSQSTGLITHGGSLGNLTALLTAQRRLGRRLGTRVGVSREAPRHCGPRRCPLRRGAVGRRAGTGDESDHSRNP